MKKVFLTGGTGSVGSAFIHQYYDQYQFYSFSRNEKMQVALKREYPLIEIIIGAVEDKYSLINAVSSIKPDICIHAAALKHVDTGEKQPIQAVRSNIIGSMNVIEACLSASVPISIGISTDKACAPDNVYGYTKSLMEKMYMEANSDKVKFACCRFGNIAGSHGSVIPYWFRLLESRQPLRLTHPDMTRLMFLPKDAATLIRKTIDILEKEDGGFILSKNMKSVNMFDLAKSIVQYVKGDENAERIDIIGVRPGEKLDENLISEEELKYTRVLEDYLIIDFLNQRTHLPMQKEAVNSKTASLMSASEILMLLSEVEKDLHQTLLSKKQY